MGNFFSNLMATIIGVVIGGYITFYLNRRFMKVRYTFDLLQSIKTKLNRWSNQIAIDCAEFNKYEDIRSMQIIPLYNESIEILEIFETDIKVISKFKAGFMSIRRKELDFQNFQKQLIEKLIGFAEKYSDYSFEGLLVYEDSRAIIDTYASKIMELNSDVDKYIKEINEYIDKEIFK